VQVCEEGQQAPAAGEAHRNPTSLPHPLLGSLPFSPLLACPHVRQKPQLLLYNYYRVFIQYFTCKNNLGHG
jgi:hypothetical protein